MWRHLHVDGSRDEHEEARARVVCVYEDSLLQVYLLLHGMQEELDRESSHLAEHRAVGCYPRVDGEEGSRAQLKREL